VIEYTVKVYGNGTYWHLNDRLHREDGPAVELVNGTKEWYLDGKRHREDGPAVEWAIGVKVYYLNGERLTEAEFNKRMKNPCIGKVVEIEGVQYKLVEV